MYKYRMLNSKDYRPSIEEHEVLLIRKENDGDYAYGNFSEVTEDMVEVTKAINIPTKPSNTNSGSSNIDSSKIEIILDNKLNPIRNELNNKVNKVTNKHLTTEDFTTEHKNKLDDLDKREIFIEAQKGIKIKRMMNTSYKQWYAGYDMMMFVSEDEDIYIAGYNRNSNIIPTQFGNQTKGPMPLYNPKKGISLIKDFRITPNDVFVLYEDGDLYAFGSNNSSQFGLGNNVKQENFIKIADDVKMFDTDKPTHHIGTASTIIVKNNGSIWVAGGQSEYTLCTGSNSNKVPVWTLINGYPHETGDIKKVLLSGSNLLSIYILREDGTFYSGGYNGYGQHGTGTQTVATTVTVKPELEGKIIIDIEIRNDFVNLPGENGPILLTDNGELWFAGKDHFGMLTGTDKAYTTYTKVPENLFVDFEEDEKIVELLPAGPVNAFFRTNKNRLFTAGHGLHGALGNGQHSAHSSKFVKLETINRFWNLSEAHSANYCTVMIESKEDEKLKVFGCNRGYFLGINDINIDTPSNSNKPEYLDILKPSNIKEIACCGDNYHHIFYLTNDGKVYTEGSLARGFIVFDKNIGTRKALKLYRMHFPQPF